MQKYICRDAYGGRCGTAHRSTATALKHRSDLTNEDRERWQNARIMGLDPNLPGRADLETPFSPKATAHAS